MELLSNPWIIGIGGGIFSGLVVTVITRAIFSRRENREYVQKVTVANHEVLYAIRPGISEGVIPTNNVILSLISATARKYAINANDMHDLNAVSSELVKEVMDSSFISAQSKQEFCSKLTSITEDKMKSTRPDLEIELGRGIQNRRQTTVVLGLMTGIMTGIAFGTSQLDIIEFSESKKLVLLIVPAVVAILASILVVLFREIEKFKLKRLDLNVGGFRAEFKAKEKETKRNDA